MKKVLSVVLSLLLFAAVPASAYAFGKEKALNAVLPEADADSLGICIYDGPGCLLADSAENDSTGPSDSVVSSFTGPSYPAAAYYDDPTHSYYNYDSGVDYSSFPPASDKEASALAKYLGRYGWGFNLDNAYARDDLVYPTESTVLGSLLMDAFDAFKPDGYRIGLEDGVFVVELYSQSIPGFVDRLSITAYVYVESKTVTGGVLSCTLQIPPKSDDLMPDSEGKTRYYAAYPLGTPLEKIQQDAAEYCSEYGKAPFNEIAALDYFGGRRVSSEYQEELSALFSWSKPHYDFLCCRYAGKIAGAFDDMRSAGKALYPAVYATSGIALTEAEASSLFFNCYYSESIYACGDNYYAVDFMVRGHLGYPDPGNPSTGTLGPDHAWLTWLVVKPLVKNADGALDRFYYAADTPQWIVAYDMKTYFNDPVNGKSLLAAKE